MWELSLGVTETYDLEQVLVECVPRQYWDLIPLDRTAHLSGKKWLTWSREWVKEVAPWVTAKAVITPGPGGIHLDVKGVECCAFLWFLGWPGREKDWKLARLGETCKGVGICDLVARDYNVKTEPLVPEPVERFNHFKSREDVKRFLDVSPFLPDLVDYFGEQIYKLVRKHLRRFVYLEGTVIGRFGEEKDFDLIPTLTPEPEDPEKTVPREVRQIRYSLRIFSQLSGHTAFREARELFNKRQFPDDLWKVLDVLSVFSGLIEADVFNGLRQQ